MRLPVVEALVNDRQFLLDDRVKLGVFGLMALTAGLSSGGCSHRISVGEPGAADEMVRIASYVGCLPLPVGEVAPGSTPPVHVGPRFGQGS